MNRNRSFYVVIRAFAARLSYISLALVLAAVAAHAQANYAGIEVNATSLLNVQVNGFAVDPLGNIYICDATDIQLYKSALTVGSYMAPAVILSGQCTPGSTLPPLAVDAAGSLYYNIGAQVLKASKTSGGFASPVVVANSLTSVSDVKVDAAGNVFINESSLGKVLEVPFSGGVYGSPTTVVSGLSGVTAIAVGTDESIYGAGGYGASSGFVIKAVYSNGSYLSPLTIGTGFNDVTGIAADTMGNVFVSSDDNYLSPFSTPNLDTAVTDLWEIPIRQPGTYVYAPPVPVGGGDFYVSKGAANDAAGNIYVLWVGGPRGSFSYNVEKIDLNQPQQFGSVAVGASTQQSVTFWITGTELTPPTIVASSEGTNAKDFTVTGTNCVPDAGTPFNTDGYPVACSAVVTFAPQASGTRYGGAQLISNDSNTVIASVPLIGSGSAPQVVFDKSVATILTNAVSSASGMAVDEKGNLFIADTYNNRILELPWNGSSYVGSVSIGTGLFYPNGVTVDGLGNVYIADTGHARVVKVPWNGAGYDPQVDVVDFLKSPTSVAVDSAGNVYVCDQSNGGNGIIFEVPYINGRYGQLSSPVQGPLLHPTSIVVDADRNLYVTDPGNNRVVIVPWIAGPNPQFGAPQTLFSGLDNPTGIAIDGNRNLYISDYNDEKVYAAQWNGTAYGALTTVDAEYGQILNVAVDGRGRLYVATNAGDRIVEYDRTTPSPLTFVSEPVGHTGSDSPQSVTVSNLGNLPLSFAVSYPKDFPADDVSSAFCTGASLAVGGSCQLQIAFKPTVTGPLSESVLITDNNLNMSGSQQSVSVSAPGSVPAPVISPGSGSYSATPTVTITDAQPGTAIYYTTNGSTPTAMSTLYTGPFPVIFSETVKAVAIANNVSSAVTSAVYTVYDSQVQVSFSASTIAYPASTLVTITLQPNATPGHSPTGTVQLFVDGASVTTLTLSGTGNGFAKAFYQLAGANAGQHTVYAVYSGDTNTAPGASAVVSLTVLPATVSLAVSCVNPTIVYGANYSCKVYTTPVAAGTNTVITYKLDSAAPVTVPLSAGVTSFTITKPAIGSHTVVISYAAQGGPNGNYGPATPKTENFMVTSK